MTPISAPSANIFGKPSPTTAEHVMDDLAGKIDVILDAGPTRIGVESTVLDMTSPIPQILRPGGTPYEVLKSVLGPVALHPIAAAKRKMRVIKARSPGMKHRHYAPEAEMVVVEGESENVVKKVQELAALHMAEGRKIGILTNDESQSRYKDGVVKSLGSRNNMAKIAKNLFRLLREFDKEKVDIIIAEGIASKGLGLAVMNRLRRAAGFNIIKVS
jgi:L-threonylcarbamoyladenylate synthase